MQPVVGPPQYASAPASDNLNSHPELLGWRSLHTSSVMQVIVFHLFTIPKIWLIFGHCVNRPGVLDL